MFWLRATKPWRRSWFDRTNDSLELPCCRLIARQQSLDIAQTDHSGLGLYIPLLLMLIVSVVLFQKRLQHPIHQQPQVAMEVFGLDHHHLLTRALRNTLFTELAGSRTLSSSMAFQLTLNTAYDMQAYWMYHEFLYMTILSSARVHWSEHGCFATTLTLPCFGSTYLLLSLGGSIANLFSIFRSGVLASSWQSKTTQRKVPCAC